MRGPNERQEVLYSEEYVPHVYESRIRQHDEEQDMMYRNHLQQMRNEQDSGSYESNYMKKKRQVSFNFEHK